MARAVRTHLALESLAGNAEVLAALTPEKREELKARAKESALLARVAVCNHVNVLFVPVAVGLEAVELDVVTQASVRPNQTDAILDRLAAMDKTLAAGDKPLDPAYVKAKLGALLDQSQPTLELVRAFARRTDLKMVLDRAQLVALVGAGVRNGIWEYYEPERGEDGWATQDRPPAPIRLAEDTYLYPLGSAPAIAELPCPFCGKVHPGTVCPDDRTPAVPPVSASSFSASGAAGKAFSDARAAAAEAGRTTLRELLVTVDQLGGGTGTELARLHTLVAASTLGVALTYDVDVTVAFNDPSEQAVIRYHGSPSDYAPLREALKQMLAPRQATLKASLRAVFAEPLALSGDDVGRLVQTAADTGPTKCTVRITTEAPA
jgi:hypothetical protein